eukprot:gene25145-30683_t
MHRAASVTTSGRACKRKAPPKAPQIAAQRRAGGTLRDAGKKGAEIAAKEKENVKGPQEPARTAKAIDSKVAANPAAAYRSIALPANNSRILEQCNSPPARSTDTKKKNAAVRLEAALLKSKSALSVSSLADRHAPGSGKVSTDQSHNRNGLEVEDARGQVLCAPPGATTVAQRLEQALV